MSLPKLFFVGIKGLIRNSQGEILLLLADVSTFRDAKDPYWDLPGGRIEEGDDELGTLRKEIQEETGVTELADVEYLHSVISSHNIPIKDSERMAGLVLRIWQVEIADDSEIKISDEHTNYEWASPKEAAERLLNKYPADFCEFIKGLGA